MGQQSDLPFNLGDRIHEDAPTEFDLLPGETVCQTCWLIHCGQCP